MEHLSGFCAGVGIELSDEGTAIWCDGLETTERECGLVVWTAAARWVG